MNLGHEKGTLLLASSQFIVLEEVQQVHRLGGSPETL
jgi:hypothetical protein